MKNFLFCCMAITMLFFTKTAHAVGFELSAPLVYDGFNYPTYVDSLMYAVGNPDKVLAEAQEPGQVTGLPTLLLGSKSVKRDWAILPFSPRDRQRLGV